MYVSWGLALSNGDTVKSFVRQGKNSESEGGKLERNTTPELSAQLLGNQKEQVAQ